MAPHVRGDQLGMGYAPADPGAQELLVMSMFKLADEHPLTKAGSALCIHRRETELGLRTGDVVFEFPFDRIVDTGMACRRYE
jgi:hypothetical protein